MPDDDVKLLVNEGLEAVAKGDFQTGLDRLDKVPVQERDADVCSSLAICLAREKGAYREAIMLCNDAIRKDPKGVRHFLVLGRIYVMADRKKEALRAFSLGLRYGASPEIQAEMKRLGMRRPPVIPFLARENPINKFLGKLLTRWGMR